MLKYFFLKCVNFTILKKTLCFIDRIAHFEIVKLKYFTVGIKNIGFDGPVVTFEYSRHGGGNTLDRR